MKFQQFLAASGGRILELVVRRETKLFLVLNRLAQPVKLKKKTLEI
jgi:hypothetical protein